MTNKIQYRLLPSFLFIAAISYNSFGQKDSVDPWKENQLMPPASLAAIISSMTGQQPLVFSIGPGALIKGSIDIGPAQVKENLEKLKLKLSKLPKDANIVIYCGCCPFDHCPNIRPAFKVLNEMKFTNCKLLSLQNNIKVDWINKGYPIAD